MTNRVAVFIANYNMPERADALYEFVHKRSKTPVDIYLVDNASDLVEPAVHTNVVISPYNKQTTAAWLEGLRDAHREAEAIGIPYFAYVFAITSGDFPDSTGDPITPLVELLEQNENAVGVHPALTSDSTTSWTHLITRGGTDPRRTWMIDNIFSMYRADWFDSIGGFDPDLRFAWGVDLETCYKARLQGLALYVHEGVQIRKITNVAYRMERMGMSADERSRLAGENMAFYLSRKYGDDWWNIMNNHLVESEWR
jgi:hypothetical protein